ncbi:folylpolyglutamate synthase/dihydrofolate synthase family protein [Sporosarcina sp. Te-1]|uniref:bifunctional folylpolyglutamate synthase/dihydrofolate synthase n=1 Tax=Sporosarcina sp. Te-1 TaxID=2818390 RepID=UPI001A9F2A23|nr:folylpolyglutamate synthase/dihydrofolate synthase family protein [Sporosarcina sp. Te-1]QTD41565.1 bifunctional folylpolyglutamate synthase/dihydrofolate synthase [Sporosarcina sp. Te-1]
MIPKLNEYKERWNIASDGAIKPGLEHIKEALKRIENPEKDLQIIHVAGTNGKGSTVAFMEAILKEHGYQTGVFSSPALVDIHDQIRLGGLPVSEAELDESFRLMKEGGISGLLTDFELLTVAAFLTFQRNAPDYVLLECGMGGDLDSTNVVKPLVSVITSVALDHEGFLGTTLAEIAGHKAGIIKGRVPVVTGCLPEEASTVVSQKADALTSPCRRYGVDFEVITRETERFTGFATFEWSDRRMKGPHQARNLGVALEALLQAGIKLEQHFVASAIAKAQLPFRFQELKEGIFLDGAHNPAAAKALADTIRTEFPGEKVDFVIGMLKTKDIRRTLDELIPVAASFTFISFPHPEAATAEQLMGSCQYSTKRMTKLEDDSIILSRGNSRKKIVAGSLYLITSLSNYINL